MKTGYFATLRRPFTRSKVHVVFIDNKPICGSTLAKDSTFQWCAMTVQKKYVECKSCLKRLKAMGV
jgi:hypothetical protein